MEQNAINFKARLAAAIKAAPVVELTSGNTVIDTAWYKGKEHPYSKLNDNDLIDFRQPQKLAYQITIKSFENYLELLKQTVRAINKANGHTVPAEDEEYEAQLAFIHEMQHSEALYETGASNPMHFGVSIFGTKLADKLIYGYYAFSQPEGKIKKIDAAKMFAGPTHLSESDKQKIIDLGYKLKDLKPGQNFSG